ncbi:MAG: hypothetical protein QY321_00195 [Patescibacteria group bacterium]|nr:MAG: hypothetical protein QY321_00195 [Patescibacteria group bacterium]
MKQRENFGDVRQIESCIYCGKGIETREHTPPKVLLDEPYPENLPVIRACKICNQGYSLDEEYFACLIECARVGSVDLKVIERDKIRAILSRKKALLNKLEKAVTKTPEGQKAFLIELERFRKVLFKIAQGYTLFEHNEPKKEEDVNSFTFGTLEMLSDESRDVFETVPYASKAPEVGSRAMQNILMVRDFIGMPWIEVQENRYRYLTFDEGVRMVFSEYVWCEIIW